LQVIIKGISDEIQLAEQHGTFVHDICCVHVQFGRNWWHLKGDSTKDSLKRKASFILVTEHNKPVFMFISTVHHQTIIIIMNCSPIVCSK